MYDTVLRKYFRLEILHRNTEVAKAWVDDKVERESAHAVIEALSSQLAMVTRRGFKAARKPVDLLIGTLPLEAKTRQVNESGIASIGWRDEDGSDTSKLVIPSRLLALEQLQEEITVINITMDRGPSNVSAMNYMLHQGHPA